MDGISGNIANLAMQMSAQSVQSSVELYTISKAMDLQSSSMAQMLDNFSQVNAAVAAPPVDGLGCTIDVCA